MPGSPRRKAPYLVNSPAPTPARASSSGAAQASEDQDHVAEAASPQYTTKPAKIDTAGRTRTWNLLTPNGDKLAEISAKRDAQRVAALLNQLTPDL